MLYTAIFKENKILSDYSEESGDFHSVIKKIQKSNKQNIEFFVIPYLNYDYYFLNNSNFTFTCITNTNLDNEKVLFLLQKIKDEYLKLIYKKEKDGFEMKTANILKQIMKESRGLLQENKFLKVDCKLNDIITEKKKQLEDTLEKDSLISKIKEKSVNLKNNVNN